jgi:hypothetical protein
MILRAGWTNWQQAAGLCLSQRAAIDQLDSASFLFVMAVMDDLDILDENQAPVDHLV